MNAPPVPALNRDPRLISRFSIRRFKSIRDQALDLGRINVLIGFNGAGKSNFIQALQLYVDTVSREPGKLSKPFGASMFFTDRDTDAGPIEIGAQFTRASHDVSALSFDLIAQLDQVALRTSGETLAMDWAKLVDGEIRSSGELRQIIQRQIVFHHITNTSPHAKIKAQGEIDDNRTLHPDGSNLAACLYLISQINSLVFQNIEASIRRVAPSFGRFELEPSEDNPDLIRLWWSAHDSNIRYSPQSLSDGTLRFMALTALLMQPRERLPRMIVLDEPELGLHPAAVQLLGSMISAASEDSQIIVSTQSAALVSQFEPEDIVIVERERRSGASTFERLSVEELEPWLAEYSLGELWEKNVLGARP